MAAQVGEGATGGTIAGGPACWVREQAYGEEKDRKSYVSARLVTAGGVVATFCWATGEMSISAVTPSLNQTPLPLPPQRFPVRLKGLT